VRHGGLAIGQENSFTWIERISASSSASGICLWSTRHVMSTRPACSSAGTPRGDREHHLAVEHGHQAAISIHQTCLATHHRPASARANADAYEDGPPRVGDSNDYSPVKRQKMCTLRCRCASPNDNRGRVRIYGGADPRGSRAMPELRHSDVFHRFALHRVRRMYRYMSRRLSHHEPNGEESDLRTRLTAPAEVMEQRFRVRRLSKPARNGQGRKRVPTLRPMCRALSHVCMGYDKVRSPSALRRSPGSQAALSEAVPS